MIVIVSQKVSSFVCCFFLALYAHLPESIAVVIYAATISHPMTVGSPMPGDHLPFCIALNICIIIPALALRAFVCYYPMKYTIRQYAVFEIPWKRIGAIIEFVFAYSQPNIMAGRKTSIAIGSAWIIMCAAVKAADDTVMAVQWCRLSFFGRSGFAANCGSRALWMLDWMYARKNNSSNTAM